MSGLFFDPPTSSVPATASLVKTDTTTQGNWIGVYGSNGYNVIGSTSSYPSYANVSVTGESSTVWATGESNPRDLEVPPNGATRIAAAWYSRTSFSVTIDLTDGQSHDVALYFLDWPNAGRSETVQITDANTGLVLYSQTISNFNLGIYQQWAISGDVIFTFTPLAGSNALLSGLFFDPPTSSVPATASLVKTDTTTQGNWIGVYGSNGYNVIGSTSSYPSYANVSVTGESSTVWATGESNPRDLEVPPNGTTRIAAAWYSRTSFSVTIDLTDGQSHDVALYFLDWPNAGRSETVQITDANTGLVLYSQVISNFNAGIYQQWAISGDVIFTFTPLAGSNALLSGLFFDPTSSNQVVLGGESSVAPTFAAPAVTIAAALNPGAVEIGALDFLPSTQPPTMHREELTWHGRRRIV